MAKCAAENADDIRKTILTVSMKGKTQYNWPPFTNYFLSAAFLLANTIYFFYKTGYLNVEVIRTEIFPLASNPCSSRYCQINPYLPFLDAMTIYIRFRHGKGAKQKTQLFIKILGCK